VKKGGFPRVVRKVEEDGAQGGEDDLRGRSTTGKKDRIVGVKQRGIR